MAPKLDQLSRQKRLRASCHNIYCAFRAFWQKRKAVQCSQSIAWLYFGCRDVTENMFALETSELVTRKVAFSRNEDAKKEYVQDLLEKDGPLIYKLIKNCQANLYICGSVG